MSVQDKAVPSNNNRWTPKNSWNVELDAGSCVFTPGCKAIDRITSPVSLENMLLKSHGVEPNKAGNWTVLYKFANGQTKVVGFLTAIRGSKLKESGMLKQLHSLASGTVSVPMTSEEMELEFLS